MIDNAPERIWTNGVWVYGEHSGFGGTEYIRADLYTAVCAERDMAKEGWTESQDLIRKARLQYSEEKARAEAAESEIQAALERLEASLFTNAEHQQAKDILRDALKEKPDDTTT